MASQNRVAFDYQQQLLAQCEKLRSLDLSENKLHLLKEWNEETWKAMDAFNDSEMPEDTLLPTLRVSCTCFHTAGSSDLQKEVHYCMALLKVIDRVFSAMHANFHIRLYRAPVMRWD